MLGEVPSVNCTLAKPQARAFVVVVPGELLFLGYGAGEVLRNGQECLQKRVDALELPKAAEVLNGCIHGAPDGMRKHQGFGRLFGDGPLEGVSPGDCGGCFAWRHLRACPWVLPAELPHSKVC